MYLPPNISLKKPSELRILCAILSPRKLTIGQSLHWNGQQTEERCVLSSASLCRGKPRGQEDQRVQRWTWAAALPAQRDPSLQPCGWWWATQQQQKGGKMAAKSFPVYIYLGFLAPARKGMNNMKRKKKMKVLTQIFAILSPFWKLQEKGSVVCNPPNSKFQVVLWRKWIIPDFFGEGRMDDSLIKRSRDNILNLQG